jgi:hypothetical protein
MTPLSTSFPLACALQDRAADPADDGTHTEPALSPAKESWPTAAAAGGAGEGATLGNISRSDGGGGAWLAFSGVCGERNWIVRWKWAGEEMGIDIGAWCARMGDTWTAEMGLARGVRVAGERTGWGYFGLCGGGGARWQRRWSEFSRSPRGREEKREHVFASVLCEIYWDLFDFFFELTIGLHADPRKKLRV